MSTPIPGAPANSARSGVPGNAGAETAAPLRQIQHPARSAGIIIPGLDGYSSVELIAHGSSAVVYRATQDRLKRQVAIKLLLIDDMMTTLENVEFELDTLVRLSQQPHIVSIIDTGFTDAGQPFIVMEYCEGGSYAQILKERGPLPVDEVLDVGIKIGEALDSAHEMGIIHRDVKPPNILRSRFGPALTDFGIAYAEDLSTTTTFMKLTPHHSSPETLLQQHQTGKSDLYSLASTLWNLLAGRPPFESPGGNPDEFRRRVLTQPVPRVPRDDVPEWLQAELARAMAKRPAHRHPSALDFAETLRMRRSQPAGTTWAPPQDDGIYRPLSTPPQSPETGPFVGSVPSAPPGSAPPASGTATSAPQGGYRPTNIAGVPLSAPPNINSVAPPNSNPVAPPNVNPQAPPYLTSAPQSGAAASSRVPGQYNAGTPMVSAQPNLYQASAPPIAPRSGPPGTQYGTPSRAAPATPHGATAYPAGSQPAANPSLNWAVSSNPALAQQHSSELIPVQVTTDDDDDAPSSWRRPLIIAAILGIVLGLLATVGVLLTKNNEGGGGEQSKDPKPTHEAKPLDEYRPEDVALEDNGATITVKWRDTSNGTTPFGIFGAPDGEQVKIMGSVDAGEESKTLTELRTDVNYCLKVLAVVRNAEGGNDFASSDAVCTQRNK